MDYHRKGNFVPVTCTYWRNSHCFKGDRCTFVHGFICRDDGICSDPLCNKTHYKQRDPSTYLKVRGRNDSRYHRYRSKSRSPYGRSRSPYSPRRKFTPKHRSRSPRRSFSPRRSVSPRRSRSNSSRRSYSPYKKSQRSRSLSRSRSRSLGSWNSKKSPPKKEGSPVATRNNSSSPLSHVFEETTRTKLKTESKKKTEDHPGDVLIIKEDKADMFYDPLEEKETEEKPLTKPKFKPIGERESLSVVNESKPKGSLRDPPQSGDVSPSARALEILKNLPKDFFTPASSDQKAKEEKASDKEKKKDKDVLKSSMDQDSFREAFIKALNESGNTAVKASKGGGQGDPLPPVLKHPLNAESLAKPFQEKLYGYEQGHSAPPGTNLWTPAHDRSKGNVGNLAALGHSVSAWEIDTPYVGSLNVCCPG